MSAATTAAALPGLACAVLAALLARATRMNRHLRRRLGDAISMIRHLESAHPGQRDEKGD